MFRALLKKEWRQLKDLRWVGLGLGVIMPPFLVLVAEAATRGWVPSGQLSSYSLDSLLVDLLPPFLVVLWMLLTFLITAQAFAGDRAAGTESFLLERPVPRARVWRARVGASLGTMLTLIAAHVLVWWLFTRAAVNADTANWNGALVWFAVGAGVGALAAFLAGMAAASLVASPLQAVLLGMVMGAVPLGWAYVMTVIFPLALYRRIPLGMAVPWLLLFGYVVASFLMLCRGEPAGRGRVLRGLAVLGIFLVMVPCVFAVSAPIAVRAEAKRLARGADLNPGTAAGATVVLSREYRGGWLVDLETQQRKRFLPPPIDEVLWSPDGSQLAVLTWSGSFGSVTTLHADLYAADGSRLRTLWSDPENRLIGPVHWVGEYLVGRVYTTGRRTGLQIVSTKTGASRDLDLQLLYREWVGLASQATGEFYVFREVLEEGAPARALLQRLDVERGELESRVIWEDPDYASVTDEQKFGYFLRNDLSPDGRYLRRMGGGAVDLETGERLELPEARLAQWMSGDRLVWLETEGRETSLRYGPVGGPPRVLRSWSDRFLRIQTSPDLERLLVRVYEIPGLTEPLRPLPKEQKLLSDGVLEELWIYEPAADRWTDATNWFEGPLRFSTEWIHWAGPQTLALSGEGFLALHDLDGGEPRHVIGG